MDVLIVTGDRDALQLVNDQITVLMTRRGISDMTASPPRRCQSKYDLTPAQYPDFAALRGDPSDNLPSIPGVGEKTAAKWMQQFGNFDALVDRVDEVKGKAGDALREHLADVIRNRQLTELRRDVPLHVGPHDLHLGQWDREEVHQLFDTLAVPGAARAAVRDAQRGEPEADEGFEVDAQCLIRATCRGWLARARAPAPTGVGCRVRRHMGTRHRRGHRAGAGRSEGGAGPTSTPTQLTAEDEAALARLARRP